MRYLVICEEGNGTWGAYVPDLPGCVAAADTREAVLELVREAIAFHLAGLREAGEVIPGPRSELEYVEVDAVPQHYQ